MGEKEGHYEPDSNNSAKNKLPAQKKAPREYFASWKTCIKEQKTQVKRAQRQTGQETSRNPEPPETKSGNTRNKEQLTTYQKWKHIMYLQRIRNRIQAQDTR